MTAFPPAPQDRIDIEKLIAHFGDRDVAEITEGDIFIAAHKICADTSNANKNRRVVAPAATIRSEEHTSELQSLMRISYAVFCLKKKKNTTQTEDIKKPHQIDTLSQIPP